MRELRTEVGTIAVDLASKIVGESLADEARRKGTVDRFLSDLESTAGPLMQAASRESYEAAAERLDAYVRGAEPSAVAATADDLLSVAGLLRREPRLRRALSDPARSGDDRAALLGGMLARQDRRGGARPARGAGRRPLVGAVGAARRRRAARRGGAAGQRRHAPATSARSRTSCSASVRSSPVEPALAAALADPIAPVEQRATLVRELLDGKARPVTVRLVEAGARPASAAAPSPARSPGWSSWPPNGVTVRWPT